MNYNKNKKVAAKPVAKKQTPTEIRLDTKGKLRPLSERIKEMTTQELQRRIKTLAVIAQPTWSTHAISAAARMYQDYKNELARRVKDV